MSQTAEAKTHESPYLRLKDAARYLNVSVSNIMQMQRRGTAPPKIKVGRLSMYKKTDLDAFMNARQCA
jgi:excisionase family DNA binding protein